MSFFFTTVQWVISLVVRNVSEKMAKMGINLKAIIALPLTYNMVHGKNTINIG